MAALAFLLGTALAATASLLHLQMNNAPEVYFPPTAPAVQFDQTLRRQFPEDQVLLALFEGDDLFEARFLRAFDDVAHRLDSHPLVDRVLSVTRADHITGSADGFAIEPLIDPGQLDITGDDARRTRALADRFAPGLLVSKDGQTLSLIVRPVKLKDSFDRLELVQATQAAIEAAGLTPRLTALSGQIVLDAAQLQSTIRDTLWFVPITTATGLLLLWWLFRRPLAVALAALSIWSAVAAAASIIVIWGRPFTLIGAIIPPLMVALTTALLVHLFNALRLAASNGLQGRERVSAAVAEIRRPALYTTLTTVAGLGSLGLSPILPIQTFGVAAAIATLYIYVAVIWLLPPILAVWDRAAWPNRERLAKWLDRIVRAAARLAIRRAGWVVFITVLVLTLTLPLLFKIEAETDLYRFFRADHPLTQSTTRIEQRLLGVTTLEVVFDGPGVDALKDPARLRALDAFQAWVESLPEVDRTFSMADIIKEMHWGFNGEEAVYRTIPETDRLISQYLLIYDGQDLYELVDRGFQRTRLLLNLNVHGANAIQAVIDQIRNRLDSTPAADLKFEIAGLGRLFADQEDLLISGQVNSLWGALILIFLMMAAQWRSLRATVICMIPNTMPLLVVFIVMGAIGIWLDMATVMIAGVVVGIAVDDTIHIFEGYARRSATGSSLAWALMRSYQRAGRAVTATTVILCAQFFLLCASRFVPTTEFGLLTGIGLIVALAFDLLFLPALLVVLEKRKNQREP